MFKNIPKIIVKAIMLIRALNISRDLDIIKKITYLWWEFKIKVRVVPKIVWYKVQFIYKDELILNTKVEKLDELIELINNVQNDIADEVK